MTPPDRYPVPAGTHRVEEEIRHSRFVTTLGRASTSEEAAAFVRAISAEHPGATHNCWAFVAGPPGSTSRIGMSDDGEPHGTAGRPMLNALLHSGVGDVVAVVTRYYGGTKLGTGGLVRAYAGGVRRALDSLERTERVEWATLGLVIDYTRLSAVQLLFPEHEVDVRHQDFGTDVRFSLRLPASQEARFRAAVLDATRGQAEFLE